MNIFLQLSIKKIFIEDYSKYDEPNILYKSKWKWKEILEFFMSWKEKYSNNEFDGLKAQIFSNVFCNSIAVKETSC